MTETTEEAQRRYLAAMHAMQSGVAARQHQDPSETEPKHLRVGVNSTMIQQGVLVQLLISKGIITEAEWFSAMADGVEAEVARYEQLLSEATGVTVRLA